MGYTRYETRKKGYDSGLTLAIWFPVLPETLLIPHMCKEYSSDYITFLKKGFNDKRKRMAEAEKEKHE